MTSICIECGRCKLNCPIYLVLKNESVSPRAKGRLENKHVLDKIFYLCSLCEGYKTLCPIKKLEINIIGAREKLVKEGIELTKNKEMIKNLKEKGNIFGF